MSSRAEVERLAFISFPFVFLMFFLDCFLFGELVGEQKRVGEGERDCECQRVRFVEVREVGLKRRLLLSATLRFRKSNYHRKHYKNNCK